MDNHFSPYQKTTTLPQLRDKVAGASESRLEFRLIDLDRFKHINDVYGHRIGDVLLRQVARRLMDRARPEDTVARLGGDEFAVLLSNCQSVEAAEAGSEAATETVTGASGRPQAESSSADENVSKRRRRKRSRRKRRWAKRDRRKRGHPLSRTGFVCAMCDGSVTAGFTWLSRTRHVKSGN